MIRDTSKQAFYAVKSSGFVSETMFEIYSCLYQHGPLTQNETWQRLTKIHPQRKKDSYGPRFAVMVQMGLLKILEARKCTVTGRSCNVYDVTSQFPSRPERKPKRSSETNASFYLQEYGMRLVLDNPTEIDIWIQFMRKHLSQNPKIVIKERVAVTVIPNSKL